MNSEHKWRFWYHKIIYFSKLAICLTFEYMLFPLGNGVRGKIRPIFAQCAPPGPPVRGQDSKGRGARGRGIYVPQFPPGPWSRGIFLKPGICDL